MIYISSVLRNQLKGLIKCTGKMLCKENMLRIWFQCFSSGNFDLKFKPRGRSPETVVDKEDLKKLTVEANHSQW